MGLFSITKKPDEKKSAGVQKAPSFPEFPSFEESSSSDFPAYEPTIGEIKKEVTKSEFPSFDIPSREKKPEPKMFAASQSSQSRMEHSGSEDHMLFIKIDKYKEAMKDVHNLKMKISEAEKILSSLDELKNEEDAKLAKWNSEIQELKNKLMSLDKNLFE